MSTSTQVRVGQPAPNFKAEAFIAGQKDFKEVSLKDYHGKWVCLYFYPRDFTFVCPTEIKAFAAKEAQFREMKCEIVACSTDSAFVHKAWFERDLQMVKHPVLADTAHSVASSYGVLVEDALRNKQHAGEDDPSIGRAEASVRCEGRRVGPEQSRHVSGCEVARRHRAEARHRELEQGR